MTPVVLTLPVRTPNPLNGAQGYSKGAVFASARLRKAHRTGAFLLVRSSLAAARITLPCVVTLTRLAPSSGLDDDAIPAALKSVRDGIADALRVNDRDPRVAWRYDQRRAPWGVEIRVESGTVAP